MSKHLFSSLPRFDEPAPELPKGSAQAWLRDLETGLLPVADAPDFAQDETALDVGEAAAMDAPMASELDGEPEQEPSLGDADLEALSNLNVSLADVIAQLDQDVQQQAMLQVQALAAQLFPKLAESFLANELAAHLPSLLPKMEPDVEIAVPASMLERLQASVERTQALPRNCRFVEATPDQSENAIRIIWPKGGYDFDFDTFLADCMKHVQSQS